MQDTFETQRRQSQEARVRRKAWKARAAHRAAHLPDPVLHLLVLVLLLVLLVSFFYTHTAVRTVAGTVSVLIAVLYTIRTYLLFVGLEKDNPGAYRYFRPTPQRIVPMVLFCLLFVAISTLQFMDPAATYWYSVGLAGVLCLIYVLVPWLNYGTCVREWLGSRMVVPLHKPYLALNTTAQGVCKVPLS